MAEPKQQTAPEASKEATGPRAAAPPVVTELVRQPGQRALPEKYYLIEDEILPPQLAVKGLAPLSRRRGVPESVAVNAGYTLPANKKGE